jgi:uncharacterized damage-inducible protein DinB
MSHAATKRQLIATALPDHPPEIGGWLWAMEDGRQRTLRALEGISPMAIDFSTPCIDNPIGALLYHIAAIEADWLYVDVLQRKFPPEIDALFPFDVRDEQGRLSLVPGMSLAAHLDRLARTRTALLDEYRSITLADFYRVRSLEHYEVTPAWVLHHLCQHEAEHRGQIQEARRLAEQQR